MKNNLILGIILALIIGGAGGFFGGMQYQKMQRGSFASGQFRGGGQGGNFQGTRPVSGEIVSVDNSSMTIKLADGSTKIVILSNSTSINKADKGSKSDLKAGIKVAAFGTANSDGSITAQTIQLNPMMRIGGTPR